MRQARAAALLVLVLGGLLAPPAHADAVDLWADPEVTDGGHDCSASDACRLRDALDAAGDGDRVVLRTGEYDVNQAIDVAVSITLEGEPGQPRPRLVGTGAPAGALLSFREGGVIRHLALDASGIGDDALTLEGAIGEDLELVADGGDGAKLHGSPVTTVLRDTVVRTSTGDGLKLRDGSGGGDVALRNVTAVAYAGTAIRCETNVGRSTLVNVLARGGDSDVNAAANGARCGVFHSNLRPGESPGVGLAETNQASDPLFADAASGDLHLQPGSHAVDAGTTDALLGPRDPDGAPRLLGAAPDIGAYEQAGLPSTGPVPVVPGGEPVPPAPPAEPPAAPPAGPPTVVLPAPVPGKTVVARPERGTVLVKGLQGWTPLTDGATVPVGALVDARRGAVVIQSASDTAGATQTGTFSGGTFRVRQTPGPRGGRGWVTVLVLAGGDFSSCPPARPRAASAAARRRSKVVRKLWGRDGGGRFRTRGRSSSATVRGTVWLTEDRCDGTRVVVREGAVDVRPNRGGRTRRVRAGRSLLVRR